MAHPYRDSAHKNDPQWLSTLDKFTEKPKGDDITATLRNHGGDPKVTAQAAYEPKKGK